MFEKPDFSLDPTAVSDEIPIGSDHTMTGDDDDDGIFIIRASYSSHSPRVSCKYCLFFVASRFSVWDLAESFPCFFLEFCSSW